ncbi:MAG: hypothetical protein VXZ72_03520 [Chlamydiota bacterium]|nr:hypothetical protein [Chlamydiota bacterium]
MIQTPSFFIGNIFGILIEIFLLACLMELSVLHQDPFCRYAIFKIIDSVMKKEGVCDYRTYNRLPKHVSPNCIIIIHDAWKGELKKSIKPFVLIVSPHHLLSFSQRLQERVKKLTLDNLWDEIEEKKKPFNGQLFSITECMEEKESD